MLSQRKLKVVFNKTTQQTLKGLTLERSFLSDTSFDSVLYSLNYHYDLGICFQDDSNYMIDYIMAGHVVETIDENIILLGLPKVASLEQVTEVLKMKQEINDQKMYIYLFVNNDLKMLQPKDNLKQTKQNLITQALRSIKIDPAQNVKSKIKK